MSSYLSNLLSRASDPPRGLRPLSTSLATVVAAAPPVSLIESLETLPGVLVSPPIVGANQTSSTATVTLNDLSSAQPPDNEDETSLFTHAPHIVRDVPSTASPRSTAPPALPLVAPAPRTLEPAQSPNTAPVMRASERLGTLTPSLEQTAFHSTPATIPRTPSPPAIPEGGTRVFPLELPAREIRRPQATHQQLQPGLSVQPVDPPHPASGSPTEAVRIRSPLDQTGSAGIVEDPGSDGAAAVPQEISMPPRALRPDAIHATHKPQTRGAAEQPSRPREEPSEPTVHITIGRLEVRAGVSAVPQRAEKSPGNAPSLEDYLRRRTRGRHE